jgi:DNA-binding PadR family transcriptional regulator
MSSTTRLLVLGVVKMFQPVHGYVVRRELASWRAQEWASIQPGSIYNALKSLTREGYLEIVGTNQVGGRPERTTYRLTTPGEEEFHTLLREEWWTVRPPIDPMMAAISFLGAVTRDEALAALEHRAAQIHGMVRHLEFGIEAHTGADSPYHVREMMQLMNARLLSEIGWAKQFTERLRNGEYNTASDPPWRPASAPPPSAATPSQPPSRPRVARALPTQPARPSRARPARSAPAALERSRTDRAHPAEPAERTRNSDPSPRSRAPRAGAPRRKPR